MPAAGTCSRLSAAKARGAWPRWPSVQSMRPVLNSPLLHDEAAAVMTTRLMTLAAPGSPSLPNTNTNGLIFGSSSVQGTSDMMMSSAPR
jgi:hypothetical protein